eukprot:4421744-Amphidinium_carterae.1
MSARCTGRRPGRLADAGSEEGAAGEVTSRAACGGALAEAAVSEASAAAVPMHSASCGSTTCSTWV